MSRPSKRTSPSTRVPAPVSCMRYKHRNNVDFPQPDGPMIAVTSPVGTANLTSRTTRDAPKYASSASTPIAGTCAGSVAAGSKAGTGSEAGREADDEDETEEDERPRPGLRVPVVVGRNCIVVDLHGSRSDRLR